MHQIGRILRTIMREIIKHYLLDDRHYRRAMLVLIGVFSAFAGVMVTLTFTYELPLWYPLLFSAVASLGAGFIAPVAMAVVIQREKAEGSFQLLCALPISKERLFFGTVLAAVVGSLVLWLPGYAVAVLASIPQGVGAIPLVITLGVIALSLSCVSASFVVTIALNTSSPTALAYVIALFFALPQLPAMLLLSERIEEKLHALLEPHLWTIMNLVLSIRGQLLVAGGLLLFSLLILFAGVQLFSSKRSYV
jgi:ABC-type transport system involved in multi-copper enzyme maturation permease subunit